MEIPSFLLDQIREGRIVLVLGAGASRGAVNSNGAQPPTGPQLGQMIADKFLGGDHRDDPLSIIAELAASESDLLTMQNYISEIFDGFNPAAFHKLLPTFKWTAIATTNFDLIMERAYEAISKRSQSLVPLIKNGDRVEDKLSTPNSLMYLKLHGCVTRTSGTSIPLILSVQQYITHRKNRDRLFDHLKNLAYEHPLVFVGQSLRDSDLRQLLLELGDIQERPRFYTVTPGLSEQEKRFWEAKRITALQGSFQDLLENLDRNVSSPFRGIVIQKTSLAIEHRFTVRDPGLSNNCQEFLTSEVEYVYNGMPLTTIRPQLFYRGYDGGWAAIDQQLDVRRALADTVLSEIILQDEGTTQPTGAFYVIKGHAGSGKSVLLRRIAWDAVFTFDKLCLFLRPHGRLSFEAVREIFQLTKQPIFIFIDKAAENVFDIIDVIRKSRRASVPLTVIAAERFNEWNISCEELTPYVTDEFEVRYLSAKEIEELLGLLERHKSLGTLENASPEQRKAAFEEVAGRQLLVALHEATLGRPFEDLILDEYEKIRPDLARLIYLGVCFLNRFDVPVRAGIIARVYQVRFTDFQKEFFKPLEDVVLTRDDWRTHDYVYRARHPHIAEIVFQRALQSGEERLDLYLRMLKALNIDYHADRIAYRRLIRGRTLLDTFADHAAIQNIYDACLSSIGDDAYLYHQMAIYEMNRSNGNLQRATEYLRKSQDLSPWDQTIAHSFAELQLRKADGARTDLEFDTHIADAQTRARKLTEDQSVSPHGYHTLAKIGIAKLERLLSTSTELREIEFASVVKQTEEAIQEGLQQFPRYAYLLEAESKLASLLADEKRALTALQSAFQQNPQNTYITVRLAKLLRNMGAIEDAKKTYSIALEKGATDKRIHYNYARLLVDMDEENGSLIEYHLRRAFTDGDRNYEAQFWFARQLYINEKIPESKDRFERLGQYEIDPVLKRDIRGFIKNRIYTGPVTKLESSYAFVTRDGTGDRIFLHITNTGKSLWSRLHLSTRVKFKIGFTFRGPAATDVELEHL